MLAFFAKVGGGVTLENLKKAAEKQLPPHLLEANLALLDEVYNHAPAEPVEYAQAEIKPAEKKEVEVKQYSEPCTTKVNKTGDWGVQYPKVDPEKCIKCGRCRMFCPDNCILWQAGLIPEFNLDYCKGCGLCSQVCPVKAIEMKSKIKQEDNEQ